MLSEVVYPDRYATDVLEECVTFQMTTEVIILKSLKSQNCSKIGIAFCSSLEIYLKT